MNHRNAIDFIFKTKTGHFILFGIGVSVAMFFVFRDTQNKKQAKREKQDALPKIAQKTTDPTATGTYSESRDFSPAMAVRPVSNTFTERDDIETPAAAEKRAGQKQQPQLLPIKIFSNA